MIDRSDAPEMAGSALRFSGGTADDFEPEPPLVRKLRQVVDRTPRQRALLAEVLSQERRVPAGTLLVTEGETADRVFVVAAGWAARYKLLCDGRRQILNFCLPGDALGIQSNFLARAPHSVTTLTDMSLAWLPATRLEQITRDDPVLAHAIHWCAAREQAMLSERLVSVGRRNAVERIGHLMLELLARLRLVGLARERSFELPLTQEILADALGLSHVHVNRSLRKLREHGLIRRERGSIIIPDLERLTEQALFSSSYLEAARRDETRPSRYSGNRG